MIKKVLSSWVFWIAVLIAMLGAASFWLPYLGIIIAPLTIVSAVLQGYENQRTEEDINTKHTQAISQIQTMQNDISTKHTEAMQEIAQAREESATRHTKALQEIGQARKEAAIQYAEAAQEIKKVRNEARAENMLLKAEKFATSLREKDEKVSEAVALCPDFRQREYRQLGLEMSAAVIGNVDYTKHVYLKSAGYTFEAPNFDIPLEEDEIAFFTSNAIIYLSEAVLDAPGSDAQGLLYLACMYGYSRQYDEMLRVINEANQISQIVQDMKAEFRERKMMLILLGACGSDQTKIERLRETLNLPRTTEQFFCNYITKEYPLNPNYRYGEFVKWVAVKRPDAAEPSGRTVITISPVYPSDEGTAYAYSIYPDGRQEEIVPADKRVPIEELYRKLSSLFILFCHID